MAILLDATLIRAVLLPAVMKLLGDANWYLPKRLGWLPRLEHEPRARLAREASHAPRAPVRFRTGARRRGGTQPPLREAGLLDQLGGRLVIAELDHAQRRRRKARERRQLRVGGDPLRAGYSKSSLAAMIRCPACADEEADEPLGVLPLLARREHARRRRC